MNTFFELIQIAIGKLESLSRVPQSREEWDELLKITGQHNLLAFTFPVIDRLHDEVNVPLGGLPGQWFQKLYPQGTGSRGIVSRPLAAAGGRY